MANQNHPTAAANASAVTRAPLSAADLLPAWRRLNEAPGRPWLIWQWTKRGFGSELIIMVLAMLQAATTGRSFRLASQGSNLTVQRGWTDWFEPFCPDAEWLVLRRDWIRKSTGLPARLLSRAAKAGWIGPRGTVLAHEVFLEVWNEKRNAQHFQIAELNIDGDLTHACSVLTKMIWRFQPGVRTEVEALLAPLQLSARPYAALHVRRGDKEKEVHLLTPEVYVERLERHRPGLHTVFVSTDDFATMAELRQLRPTWDWRTLAQPDRTGHLQRRFNHRPVADRRHDTIELLADIEALRGSAFFVGTASSNLSRVVALFQGLETCAFVDGPFSVVSSATLFRPPT